MTIVSQLLDLESYSPVTMDHYETIWIKQEETDGVPDEPGLMSDRPITMDHRETIWIKQEETDGVPDEPRKMPFCGDPLKTEVQSLSIKGDPELKLCQDSSEVNSIQDPVGIPGTSDFIKEEPCLNLETDETVDIVVATTRCAVNSTRVIQNVGESCGISLEETITQGHSTNDVFIDKDGVQQPSFICKSCGEKFSSDIDLEKHLKINVGDQVQCSGHNGKVDCMNKHEAIFLEGPGEVSVKEQTENQCSYQLKGQSLRAIGTKSHKCNVCGKSFTTLYVLKAHALMHTGMSPYKCDVCGKSFIQLGHLKKHVLIHTGMRPHKCDVCGKSFIEVGALKTHSLIHTGMRPYKCVACSKTFTKIGNLNRHAFIHTGRRPHKCEVCGKTFMVLGDLKRHAKRHRN